MSDYEAYKRTVYQLAVNYCTFHMAAPNAIVAHPALCELIADEFLEPGRVGYQTDSGRTVIVTPVGELTLIAAIDAEAGALKVTRRTL